MNKEDSNPDILTCLANLSNDEVFTPPDVADQMLDMLPQGLFSNPDATFLDPCCKTGVFLREIAKRLLNGLKEIYPNLQERADHIYKKQLFGIAISHLTAELSRRTLYCAKDASGKYSIVHFDRPEGNILYPQISHSFGKDGKCQFCPSKENKEFCDPAYPFIETSDPKGFFNMTFDVVIGNPPYHLETGEKTKQAAPIYNKFVENAKRLDPKYLVMIIPAKWYAGGMGLDGFRAEMLNDGHITEIIDFPNAKDIFQEQSIGGGVMYLPQKQGRKRALSLC
ncbi:MAG: Eco57I restriction-modification methylase domain-containing protein [Aeriscardovia sp.]|nr:Eco57I restriction-modification methylase domain-containing protein [Aeriscardovia sp.]